MEKKQWMAGIIVMIWVLAGCGSRFYAGESHTTSPGGVLGLTEKEGGSDKIVTFEVVGKGLEPETALSKGEAVLMAERAAIMDGYRQFAEKLRGVYVDAYMRAGYGSIDHDLIKTNTQSWLRGVEIVEIRRVNHGITEAAMMLRVHFTQKGMVWWPNGIGSHVRPM